MFNENLIGTPHYVGKAMAKLIPRGNNFTVKGDDWSTMEWDENNPDSCPTEAEVATLAEELRVVDLYAIPRRKEYPDWGTQLNKIYDDGLTKWKSEMVDPIKAKYPKP
jgi:hypothetical protein